MCSTNSPTASCATPKGLQVAATGSIKTLHMEQAGYNSSFMVVSLIFFQGSNSVYRLPVRSCTRHCNTNIWEKLCIANSEIQAGIALTGEGYPYSLR